MTGSQERAGGRLPQPGACVCVCCLCLRLLFWPGGVCGEALSKSREAGDA